MAPEASDIYKINQPRVSQLTINVVHIFKINEMSAEPSFACVKYISFNVSYRGQSLRQINDDQIVLFSNHLCTTFFCCTKFDNCLKL